MIGKSAVFRLAVFVCTLLVSAQSHGDNAYLNPARIFAGDVTELVLEYDNKIPSLYALDTTELERDFRLLETNSRIMRVNDGGEIYHRMQWRLRLQPRRSGILTVPSIRIGERQSRAQQLEVLPADADMLANQRVFIEVESAPVKPYPGQQVLLKTRLFFNTPISDGRLGEPEADAAAQFGNNAIRRYRVQRDGDEFEVLEKVTALVPEAAGPLQLGAATWDGIILTRDNLLRRQRSIYRQSARLELDVRDRPAGYSGTYWLPARRLTLSRQWQRPAQPLEAGAAVDFTLRITAVGVPAEALPDDLLASDREEVRIYPDSARRSNEFDGSDLVGRLEQRYVVILPRAGSIEIPGIDLSWWNVDSERQMSARLDGEVVEVAAAPLAGSVTPISSIGSRDDFLPRPARLLALPLLAAALGLFWWLSKSGLWSRGRRYLAHRRRRRQVKTGLERACRNGDASAARRLLLEWVGLSTGEHGLRGLHQIEILIGDPALGDELRRLDAALYSPRRQNWRGERLWRLLRSRRGTGGVGGGRALQALPDLYPG